MITWYCSKLAAAVLRDAGGGGKDDDVRFGVPNVVVVVIAMWVDPIEIPAYLYLSNTTFCHLSVWTAHSLSLTSFYIIIKLHFK